MKRDILTQPKRWLYISYATIGISILLIATLGLNLGIDFAGGSLLEVAASQDSRPEIERILREEFNLSATIQPTQDDSLLIRTQTITEETHQDIVDRLQEAELVEGESLRFETIGPTIGRELRRRSVIAITLVSMAMITYLAYTFRSMKSVIAPWKLGVAAVYALLHDLIVVTAFFAVFGKIWGAPVDTLFVTAQLAIMGYSVNDTIIIFSRLKAEWLKNRNSNFLELLNIALKNTLARSLNTSFTVLLVLIALLVFGGSTIRWFIVALTVGTIVGSYSSLFVASPMLHHLAQRNKPK